MAAFFLVGITLVNLESGWFITTKTRLPNLVLGSGPCISMASSGRPWRKRASKGVPVLGVIYVSYNQGPSQHRCGPHYTCVSSSISVSSCTTHIFRRGDLRIVYHGQCTVVHGLMSFVLPPEMLRLVMFALSRRHVCPNDTVPSEYCRVCPVLDRAVSPSVYAASSRPLDFF